MHFYSKRVVVLSIIKPLFSVAVLHTLLSFVYVHNKTPSRRIIDGKKEKMVTSRWAFSIAETCFQLLFLCYVVVVFIFLFICTCLPVLFWYLGALVSGRIYFSVHEFYVKSCVLWKVQTVISTFVAFILTWWLFPYACVVPRWYVPNWEQFPLWTRY